jgi:hypothetical protein
MIANTETKQLQRANPMRLAQDIEKLFKLDLAGLYTLPLHIQLQIIAKARTSDLWRIASQSRKGNS